MLQIKGICKTYHTGGLTQQALDHVSLNLRDSEFVAILGQSGSGKTTLLNIVGGLDRYDEGDLIINGVSTKKYSDRDWDSYRNHTVGFVFQSYNLIPHQTILANVELALTISGISRRERTQRAREALEQVGLGEHIHKRPSQLSGGQMQRVAIARALVNDPDILLADEPTGALDSDTSIQVMDLLKEVARDRLVVMVTHNPELAEQYATRIVNLRDGVILSDSDPFEPEAAEGEHRNMGRASMSFLTALLLSFNNLRTKKARTILVSFAGSIGIIGIAMILSLSTGVDRYIQGVEEETLQGYPLQITDTSFDFMSMYMPNEEDPDAENPEPSPSPDKVRPEPEVREWLTVTNMFSGVTTNDLKSLKEYLESDESGMAPYTRSIEYDYNLTPQIWAMRNGAPRQVNPDNSFSALGFTNTGTMNTLMSTFSSTDSFHAMPADEGLYVGSYDVKAGHWPEDYDECVLVLTSGGRVTDLTLYTLGLKDPRTLDEMVRIFAEGGSPETDRKEEVYDYEDFLDIPFYLVSSTDYYVYDKDYKVWTDKTGDKDYMKKLVENAETLTVVGVVQPREDASSPILSPGIGYPASLTKHVMALSAGSDIVAEQLRSKDVNVFTGEAFGQEADREGIDMSTLFAVDEEAMKNAFQFDDEGLDFSDMDLSDMDFSDMDLSDLDLSQIDFSAIDMNSMDLSSAFDMGSFAGSLPSLSSLDVGSLLSTVKIDLSRENMEYLFSGLLSGYLAYAAEDPATDYRNLPEAISGYLRTEAFQTVLQQEVDAIMAERARSAITGEELQALITPLFLSYASWASDMGYLDLPLPEEGSEAPAAGPIDAFSHFQEFLETPEAQEQLQASAEYLQGRIAQAGVTEEQRQRLLTAVTESYQQYAAENGLPDLSLLMDSFSGYLATPAAQTMIMEGVDRALDTSVLESRVTGIITSFTTSLGTAITDMMTTGISALSTELMGALMDQLSTVLMAAITEGLTQTMENMTENFGEQFADAFHVDFEAIGNAFSMNMDEGELMDLMSSLMSGGQASYDSNLKKLSYATADTPSTITIYPVDFDGKAKIKEILTDYNEMQLAAGEEDKVITYTDVVDALMGSVTDIINAISYVLIAFVAISLVVSSIMIGVITYISVLERNKEIGILRAIGASKRNISEVFNAETFIIGLLAGLIGVFITWVLLFPANHIIHSLTDADVTAVLPLRAAVVLVILSIILTLIGGIIPSRKAARSDPVAALRSE